MSINIGGPRIKYDSELLLHYIFDSKFSTYTDFGEINVIKICKTRVKKKGGNVLAHYFAQIFIKDSISFEFHPGSQPKTFQNITDVLDNYILKTLILCDNCCRNELKYFVEGENNFNLAFKNCESILCKRKSSQSVLAGVISGILIINIFYFSWLNIFIIFLLILLLYYSNNFYKLEPKIFICEHSKLNNVSEKFLKIFLNKFCKNQSKNKF